MIAFIIYEKIALFCFYAHFGQTLVIFKKNSSCLCFSFLEVFYWLLPTRTITNHQCQIKSLTTVLGEKTLVRKKTSLENLKKAIIWFYTKSGANSGLWIVSLERT